jgi:hypothetical protein
MDENDLIITIAEYLLNRTLANGELAITYADIEHSYSLPEGSVAKYLEEAAKDGGMEITRRGSTRASLHKIGQPTGSAKATAG